MPNEIKLYTMVLVLHGDERVMLRVDEATYLKVVETWTRFQVETSSGIQFFISPETAERCGVLTGKHIDDGGEEGFFAVCTNSVAYIL